MNKYLKHPVISKLIISLVLLFFTFLVIGSVYYAIKWDESKKGVHIEYPPGTEDYVFRDKDGTMVHIFGTKHMVELHQFANCLGIHGESVCIPLPSLPVNNI